MVDRNLIVPFRRFTSLKECDLIIVQALGIDRSRTYTGGRQTKAEMWQGWIDACFEENKKRLTAWEAEFLIETRDWLDRTGKLPQWRQEKLEEIYTEKT